MSTLQRTTSQSPKDPARKRSQRPEGMSNATAAVFAAQRDHNGEVLISTREMTKGHFAPGHSPSGPARKLLWLLTHLAHYYYAQNQNSRPADHTLEFKRAALRISRHESGDRVKKYLLELKGTVYATATAYRGWEGERFISILEEVFFPDSTTPAAPVLVRFHPIFHSIFSDKRLGEAYGRMHLPVLLGLESKYAITLYAIGQTLLHLSDRGRVEVIPLSEVRTRMGLEDGKWKSPSDILKMFQAACEEVSAVALTFKITVEPVRPPTYGGPVPKRGRGAAIIGFKVTVHPCSEDEIMAPDLEGLDLNAAKRVRRVLPAREAMVESVKKRRAAVTRRWARKMEQTAQQEQARAGATDALMDKLSGEAAGRKKPDPTIDRSGWATPAPFRPGASKVAPAAAPTPVRRSPTGTHAESEMKRGGEMKEPSSTLEQRRAQIRNIRAPRE